MVTYTRTKAKLPPAVLEWRLQAAACKRLFQMIKAGANFAYAGDQNAAKRGYQAAAIAKATGMMPGEPDMRLYLPGGKLKMIEMKAKRTPVSADQEKRHPLLASLGFEIVIVRASTEDEAADAVEALVRAWLGQRVAANDNVPVAARRGAA